MELSGEKLMNENKNPPLKKISPHLITPLHCGHRSKRKARGTTTTLLELL